MTHFISVQNTYDNLELALFSDNKCICVIQEDKRNASRLAIPLLSTLLADNDLTLKDLSFIGVNYGPGPFTTLRVIIATVNGLSFATKLPLIGIDGLDALLSQCATTPPTETVALLNAFNNDVYFGIQLHNWPDNTRGYAPIQVLLSQLATHPTNSPIRFVGNAASLYKNDIIKIFSDKAYIDEHYPTCSIEQIGYLAYNKWQHDEGISSTVSPHYLKSQHYKNQQGTFTLLS